ncbi:hypothetical protein PX669_05965 [Acinetobacter soli]|nr:hypothetical protein PX669_05965 [Acinetobacter soli]
MIDLEKERKLFQDFLTENYDFENHEQTYFDEKTQCYVNDCGEDTEHLNIAWETHKKCAESKQAEIDSLKAYRSDFEIIQQTIALVDLLAKSTNVYQRDPSCLYPFESENPRVKEWWRTACKIQELLTNTDPENCDFDEYKKMIEAAQENSHDNSN